MFDRSRNHLQFLLLIALFAFQGCQNDEAQPVKNSAIQTSVTFLVPQGALNGTLFQGTSQPNAEIMEARFSKGNLSSSNYVNGNVSIAVKFPESDGLVWSKVFVELYLNGRDKPEKKATLVPSFGVASWTAPLSTLAAGGTTPLDNQELLFRFSAENASGQIGIERQFKITVLP